MFSIIVVAEGDEAGGAFKVKELIDNHFGRFDTKVTILGHIQRGGNPSCMDRVLACRLGLAAVEAIKDGKSNVMIGEIHKSISFTPFENATKNKMNLDGDYMKLVDILT